MIWHLGTQGGTQRIITLILPDGRHYVAIRVFRRYHRFIF